MKQYNLSEPKKHLVVDLHGTGNTASMIIGNKIPNRARETDPERKRHDYIFPTIDDENNQYTILFRYEKCCEYQYFSAGPGGQSKIAKQDPELLNNVRRDASNNLESAIGKEGF